MSWITKEIDLSDQCTSVEVLHVTGHESYCEKERVEYTIDPNTGEVKETTSCVKWGQKLLRARLVSVDGAVIKVKAEAPTDGLGYVCVGVVCNTDTGSEYKIVCEEMS